MKKVILSIAVVLVSLASMAQKSEFNKTMGETLGQFATCKNVADFQALGNKFQMIANVEKGEWLPLYYHAHCYILMSFFDCEIDRNGTWRGRGLCAAVFLSYWTSGC